MYLSITNQTEVSKLRRSVKSSGHVVSSMPPFKENNSKAVLIKELKGGIVGYIIFSIPDESIALPGGLLEIGVLKSSKEWTLSRLLPNIMRSLKLDTVYSSSDNLELVKSLFHNPFEFNHVFQAFSLNASTSGEKEGVTVTEVNSFKPGHFLAKNETEMFNSPLYSKNDVQNRYSFRDSRGFIGYVASNSFGADSKQRALFPVVLTDRRRNGFGSEMVSMAADIERKNKREPVFIFTPEEEIGARLAEKAEAEHMFDLLEIRPQFHLTPVKERELEID